MKSCFCIHIDNDVHMKKAEARLRARTRKLDARQIANRVANYGQRVWVMV